jgi:hypothetical protein
MRTHIVKIFLALLSVLLTSNSPCLFAQEAPVQDGFVGRGIARIAGGDIETARQLALADAQSKAIMEALSMHVPLEVFENNFLILRNSFFKQPAVYIQSFRILYENTTFDTYQISIQALVPQDLLKKGLEEIGLITQPKDPLKVLVMIAETSTFSEYYVYWWASSGSSQKLSDSDQKLRAFLTEKGFIVLDPLQIVQESPSVLIIQGPEPDTDMVCRVGVQYGADLVIVGKAEIVRSKGTEFSTFSAYQCNLKAHAVSVKDRRAIISTGSYGLGVNTDDAIAYKNSIEKACKQLSDTLADKIKLLPGSPG